MSVRDDAARVEALAVLSGFRTEFYRSLTARADALFELTDALLCTDGPVKSLVDLVLAPEHRRGHGGMYDGLSSGRVDVTRLRRAVAGLAMPRAADGRIVLAVDVSPWLRSDAQTSPDRLFCHVYGRAKSQSQLIPGWPYSFVAALETGRTSWTAILDAARLGPTDDMAAVTADQLRQVVQRLIAAGHHTPDDPQILIVCDAGYDILRLAFLLADLPVDLLGRLRSDRVMALPPPARTPATTGRPRKHGPILALNDPATWPASHTTATSPTSRYGAATATGWNRAHPRLTRRTSWIDHDTTLPIIEGTLIRLQVDHLPGDRHPKPVWLWTSIPAATVADVDRSWQAYLRRFDLEHTFRLLKQTLGRTRPKIRTPQAADRWTWLVIACHTQLRLARSLTADLRRPWERPTDPDRLTPHGFAADSATSIRRPPTPPARQNPARPDLGRPPGSKNRQPTPGYDVGKTVKRALSITE
jgi:hypothetical protein